ncbi:hypothetical protein GCM10020331_074860 [Ectobacillus funiculus]
MQPDNFFYEVHSIYMSLNPLIKIITAIMALKGFVGSFDDKALPSITPGIDPNNRLNINT